MSFLDLDHTRRRVLVSRWLQQNTLKCEMPSRRPLPWCKGPKLRHFDFGVSSPESVQFLYKIGSGLHAEVYRAQINNEQFAVKVVSQRTLSYPLSWADFFSFNGHSSNSGALRKYRLRETWKAVG